MRTELNDIRITIEGGGEKGKKKKELDHFLTIDKIDMRVKQIFTFMSFSKLD